MVCFNGLGPALFQSGAGGVVGCAYLPLGLWLPLC